MSHRFCSLSSLWVASFGVVSYVALISNPALAAPPLQPNTWIASAAQTPPAAAGAEPGIAGPDGDLLPASFLITVGDRGDQVNTVQTLLQRLGYFAEDVDGIYGQATKTAVLRFQLQMGLPADGQVDRATWQRLQATHATPALAEAESQDGDTGPESATESATESGLESGPAPTDGESEAGLGQNWMRQMLMVLAVGAALGTVAYSLSRYGLVPQVKRPRQSRRRSANAGWLQGLFQQSARPSGIERAIASGAGRQAGCQPQQASSADRSRAQPDLMVPNKMPRPSEASLNANLLQNLHSRNPSKRQRAIWDLGQQGDSDAIQPLASLMADSDAHQRCLILAAISEIGIRALQPTNQAMLISMQDQDLDVRKNAMREVTRIYSPMAQVSQLLQQSIHDPDPDVQKTAQWAIARLERIRSLPTGEESVSLGNVSPTAPPPLPDPWGNPHSSPAAAP